MGQHLHALGSVDITFQVMAVAEVSTKHKHPIEPATQPLYYEYRVHPTRAHSQYRPQVGGILAPGDAGQISRGVGTPFAQKRQDLGFEHFRHVSFPFNLGDHLKTGAPAAWFSFLLQRRLEALVFFLFDKMRLCTSQRGQKTPQIPAPHPYVLRLCGATLHPFAIKIPTILVVALRH
jgi:hypothetical protein